jgi:hypothetical protein
MCVVSDLPSVYPMDTGTHWIWMLVKFHTRQYVLDVSYVYTSPSLVLTLDVILSNSNLSIYTGGHAIDAVCYSPKILSSSLFYMVSERR